MRYVVYTDGAGLADKNIAGCSYLILTETDYIASDSVSIAGMANPTHAETISIGLAAAYFIDNVELNPDDVIEFNVDCISAITFYNQYAFNNDIVKTGVPQIKSSMLIVRKLTKKCKVQFQKVKAHKGVLNPNMYADRLAKLAIWRN